MNISTEDFDYESLPTTSLGINMTAGAIAGILEHTVMYPLDSVKTRMQSLLPTFSGYDISTTFRNMVKKEGIMRPIRGLTAVVAGAGPAHALHFASYEVTKELVTKFTTWNHLNYIVSGAVATLIHDAVSNPTEVIKQRMQMYNSPYKSVITCMLGVYRTEGFKAFYRSYATQLFMNVPHQAIQFTTYEFFQNVLNHDRKYNPPVHVVAGGAAGACAAAITTPLDVVKTLLNTQETGFTKGMVDAIQQIHTVAGLRGFFKGLTARVLYSMPATAICWSTYEFFKFYLCGFEHDQYKSSITGKNQLQARETEFESAVAAASGMISAGEDNEHAYVLPSPPSVVSPMSNTPTSHVPAAAVNTMPSTTTLSSSTVTSSLPTPAPAPPSSASIKTVCELTTSVATPTLNLNTRHSEMKQPFDRGFSSQ